MIKVVEKPVNFLKEVKTELTKVSWSTREELVGSTVMVIVITFILAAFIGVADLLLTKGLSTVLR